MADEPIHTKNNVAGKFCFDIYQRDWIDKTTGTAKTAFSCEIYRPFDSKYGLRKDRKIASWQIDDFKKTAALAIKVVNNFKEAYESGKPLVPTSNIHQTPADEDDVPF